MMVWQTMETEMSQHTELIVKLLKFADTLTAGIMTGHDHPNSQDELDRLNSARFLREAADALQAMERVPMTDIQAVDIFVKAVGHDKLSYMIASVRLVEAHHGITPPESI